MNGSEPALAISAGSVCQKSYFAGFGAKLPQYSPPPTGEVPPDGGGGGGYFVIVHYNTPEN